MMTERLSCDPEVVGTEQCRLYQKIGKCMVDRHHLFYPRRDYKRPVEKEFRNLPENKVIMCRDEHNGQHTLPIPEKPSLDVMHEAVKRQREIDNV